MDTPAQPPCEGRVRDRALAWLASEGIEPTPEAG
jgi:hypothetical protein